MNTITDSCHYLLENYPLAIEARDYINSRLSEESKKLFKCGYFPNAKNINTLISLVGREILEKNQLYYTKNIENSSGSNTATFCFFENYPVIFPFRDVYGKTIALIGRTLYSEDERRIKSLSKYKNTIFNKGDHLFGLYENKEFILKNDFVYIVEGQIDVIKAMEVGLRNVVALSNSNMTDYQFSLICRYTNNIFLLLDNDEAGDSGRKRIINKYNHLCDIKNIYIESKYKDIDEYISNEKIKSHNDIYFILNKR